MVTDVQRQEASPLPPTHLRVRVNGLESEEVFRWAGRRIAGDLLQIFGRSGQRPDARVLDFGCGCGRVLTYLSVLSPRLELHGVDVDTEAINWCHDNLSHVASFDTTLQRKALSFADESLDTIYLVSVFTHLTAEDQSYWLAEFQRVLRPSGFAVISLYGEAIAAKMGSTVAAKVAENGLFYVNDGGTQGLPDWYQSCFHTKQYVMDTWSRFLAVEDYREAGIADAQDVVVLRK